MRNRTHRGQLFKLRQVFPDCSTCPWKRANGRPCHSSRHSPRTAIVGVADADQGFWVGNRQVMKQDGIDQREDCGVGSDTEGEGEQHSAVGPAMCRLAECVASNPASGLSSACHLQTHVRVRLSLHFMMLRTRSPLLKSKKQDLMSALCPGSSQVHGDFGRVPF